MCRKDTTPVPYLGLADLGQAGGVEAEDGYSYPQVQCSTHHSTVQYSVVQCSTVQYSYQQDGDNYLDICLDLGPPNEAASVLGAGSLHLEV